ncbi:alkyl hydroperoxide reductase subunit F [Suttonella ornithocola]|uniref:Alkyl hydroperoxide reductase subunit F n=1 Tax=Suttonella ornithocola TaxID=279832 RepID=A0A380MNZ5_9GAMM|nr:alkyl hydroperoxide reductase subunit F [Suttonella ornithocola]SUO93988.1 Alkyl hydroperoxide reductase subunit F [Suttonella ornithocola]
MLDQNMLEAVKQYTANLSKSITFVLQTGEHNKRVELKEFLSDLSAVSDKLSLEERDFEGARSPVSFTLEADKQPTDIIFSGIPGGHEFSSLILAILQAGGTALKLDSGIQTLIRNIQQPLKFETFVSLSCHNCPDVVQALNQFALLNKNIQSEMIDGGLFQEEIEARNIQGVPSVYLNGESFANGKIDTAKLIEKLIEKYPEIVNSNHAEQLPVQDVTVIGGGPAGASAAIYAARKGLKVTLIADRIGGQVKDTMGIENLIGTKETTGPVLAAQLQEHIAAYEITVKENLTVKNVEKGEKTHKVTLKTGEVIETRTLIIASGAKWRELGVPGEKENLGKGVAYCPHCDGPFFKGKHVAVIGGGNSGIEAALDLAGIVKHVSVFEFAETLKADKVLVEAAEKKENIDIYTNVATQSIQAESGKVNAIRYQNRADGSEHQLDLEGVFVQIGLVPNTTFVKDVVECTRFGEIVINAKGETNIAGIFAAGDCTTVPYKQIVIAMGEGAKAALSAFDYLIRQN